MHSVVGNDIGIAETRKQIIYHAGETRFFIFDDDVDHRRNIKFLLRENWEWIDGFRYERLRLSKNTSRRMSEKIREMIEILNTWMDNDNIIQIGYTGVQIYHQAVIFIPTLQMHIQKPI